LSPTNAIVALVVIGGGICIASTKNASAATNTTAVEICIGEEDGIGCAMVDDDALGGGGGGGGAKGIDGVIDDDADGGAAKIADETVAVTPEKRTIASKESKKMRDEEVAESANDVDDEDDDEDDDDAASLPHGQCGLYLAPSTLPHAGLGIFSGSAIPHEQSINEYIGGTFPGHDDDVHPPLWTDIFIPIADDYKSLPYRGQQRFPSWLSYVWPRHIGALSDLTTTAFPVVPEELWDIDLGFNYADGLEFHSDDTVDQRKRRVNAFVPGLASLANSDGRLYNMERSHPSGKVDYDGQASPWQPGAGAFTPHHGVEFHVAKKGGVFAGMELVSEA
jgi:hypothetical protein